MAPLFGPSLCQHTFCTPTQYYPLYEYEWSIDLDSFGYNNGIAGSLVDLDSWVAVFPTIDTINTTGAQKTTNSRIEGTVVAMYTLGAFFGALSCIFIGDLLGRKRTILLGAAINTGR